MSGNAYTPIDIRATRLGHEPEILFGLFNLTSPLAQWEIAIGRVSSHVVGSAEGFGISAWAYRVLEGLALAGATQRYRDEMILELAGRAITPAAVSRLDRVYLFPDPGTACRAIDRWGWHNITISEVCFWPTNSTRVDSEWITERLGSGTRDWFADYWSGASCNEQRIEEVLATGVGVVVDNDLRQTRTRACSTSFPTPRASSAHRPRRSGVAKTQRVR